MKQLKQNTIKQYTTKQLLRHLDRYLAQFDTAPFHIDQYGTISAYNKEDRAYWPAFNTHDKDDVVEVLRTTYVLHNKNH